MLNSDPPTNPHNKGLAAEAGENAPNNPEPEPLPDDGSGGPIDPHNTD